jgi:hypothetical protein
MSLEIRLSEDIKEDILNAANFLRLGLDALAGQKFIVIVDELMRFCSSKNNQSQHIDMQKLEILLSIMLTAQENKNFILMADILEYQLITLLKI